MKILVINCGSSSLKFELFESGKDLKSLAEGLVDRIGQKDCKLTFKGNKKNLGLKASSKNHTEALKLALETLQTKDIKKVGHRVVHGGEKYQKPVKIDAKVLKEIQKLAPLAPLHNPVNIEGIKAAKKLLPKAKHIAVFDTAFHQTIPEKAYLYAIPRSLYEKNNIRRYGFHGTNHEYVTHKVLNKSTKKIISIHLGNGSSITASQNGEAIDTTMGFTPLEGLPMGTRSGTIDPAIVLEIQKIKKFDRKKTDNYLNHKCGLLALSEISSDMRDIYEASLKGNKKALQTIEILSYQIAKHVGALAATLNGVDALIFTGGLGEKAFYVRQQACEYLSHLGVQLDKRKNKASEKIISSSKSKTKVYIIKADEEYQIAKHSQAR
ncbi:acetate kinase [Candidatus Peregrinibacteria bacterium]|jgi:acetate kinase|nr:acetate kinase [Candidatus Peregrinibacteria bacterium]MBT4055996.1 acetate kinase [Candidatus Peregrinibacteria bacterium]